MEAETEETLRSSVNHENGDRNTSGCSKEEETEESLRSSVNHENGEGNTSQDAQRKRRCKERII